MKEKVNSFLTKHGKFLCSLAVAVTSLGALSCRGIFYQPKEPDELKKCSLDKPYDLTR